MGILASGHLQVEEIGRYRPGSGKEDLHPCAPAPLHPCTPEPRELSPHLSSQLGDRTLPLNMIGSDLWSHQFVCAYVFIQTAFTKNSLVQTCLDEQSRLISELTYCPS